MMTRLTHVILLSVILCFAVSCNRNGGKDGQSKDTVVVVDPDDTIAGRKVKTIYSSGSPNEVDYYRIDGNGNQTNEIIRKIFYYDDDVKQSNGLKQKYMEGGIRNDSIRDGVWKVYHKNGKLQVSATYRLGISVGEERVYYENGQLAQLGYYDQNGNYAGEWKFYYQNGTPYSVGSYDANGMCTGDWTFYDENGKVHQRIHADEQTVACRCCPKCRALISLELASPNYAKTSKSKKK